MEIITKQEHFADTGEAIESFVIRTRKGIAHGFFHNNIISIHHINNHQGEQHCMKGIMGALCRRYKTNSFKFLMVINSNLEKRVKGIIVMIPPDDPKNPFGEWLKEIHGEWQDL